MQFLQIRRSTKWLSGLFGLVWFLAVPAAAQQLGARGAHEKIAHRVDRAQALRTYNKQPLSFEEVPHENDKPTRFVSRGLGYALLLTPAEAVLALRETSLHMHLVGANPEGSGMGVEGFPGHVNYFAGNDPKRWTTNVPAFAKVKYTDVYPGVDLIYYGNQQQLEYDFVVQAGGDPKSIRLNMQGARSVRIDRNGDLLLKTRNGEISFHKPIAYQLLADGAMNPVEVRYIFRKGHVAAFELGAYDTSRPLVIDPVVSFATYLGGDVDPAGQPPVTDALSIATDPNGNIYVTGTTTAVNDGVFPIIHAYQPNPPATDLTCPQLNAFVAKLDAAGNRIYITYLGGSTCNLGRAIAADAQGNAVVTGWTESSNFPTTPKAFQTTKPNAGVTLASFVTKFDAAGGLVYSSYIAAGNPGGVAIDGLGNAYLTGETDTTFSPKTSAGAYQTTCASTDTYIVELSPSGMASYVSCLGTNTGGGGITVDLSGNVYVTGGAFAGTSLVIKNGFQSTITGHTDTFLVKLFPGGAGAADLLYSTFFGGSEDEEDTGLAVNGNGQVWVVGNTGSIDLPVTTMANKSPCVPRFPGSCTAWVAKFDTTLTGTASLVFATYLGGSSADDSAQGVALDPNGNAFVAGYTASADFPTLNPIYGCPGCSVFNESTFITEFSPTGTMLFSTFLGGGTLGGDETFGIAIDPSGNLLLTGETGSENLPPATPIPSCMNPVQAQSVGGLDAFVVKLSPAASAQSTTTTAISSVDPAVFGQSITFTATVGAAVCTAGAPTGTVTILDGATPLGSGTLTNGQFAVVTAGLGVGIHNLTASYSGGGGFSASTSAVLIETISQAATLTTVTSSQNPANPGQSVTFTAAVVPVAPGAGIPTGTVTFFDGTTNLGMGSLSAQFASINVSTLSQGSHSITASYGGDANFTASTSAVLAQQMMVNPPTISKAFGAAAIVQGFSIDLDFSISNPNSIASLLGVGVVDTLPAGLVVATPNGVTGSCGGGTISAVSGSSTVSLSGATLPPGSNCVFTVNVTGTAPGVITNVSGAVTSSNGGSGNTAVANITELPAMLSISLNDSIKVTDTPVVPSAFVNVAESIKVTDTPAAANTLTGNNVIVKPVDTTTGGTPITMTFANVTQPGLTGLTTTTGGPPPPSGFQLGTPPVYYNLTTTAVYSGAIQICVNYIGISFPMPPGPRLYHYQGGNWVDVTTSVDTTNMIVCGSSTSLSPFALFTSGSIPTTTSITAPSIIYGNTASVTVSVRATSATPGGVVSLSVDGGSASSMTLTGGSAIFNFGILGAGSHALAASFVAQEKFLASGGTGMLVVTQAPLSVSGTNAIRPYGAGNPVLTGSLAGVVNGDPITASFTTQATPSSGVGTYLITPIVLDPQNRLGNYVLTLVNGTLTIVPEMTSLGVAIAPQAIRVGQSAAITVTLSAPDMVIPIDPSVLGAIQVSSPIVSDILTNNGRCTPVVGSTAGTASCVVTLTAVEPNGRTVTANFAGSTSLLANAGTANLVVTAPLESKMSCINSDFRSVSVPGGSYLWFNSIFKVRDVPKQKVTITFFQSTIQFQYTDVAGNLVKVNQSMPDAKIVIDPSVASASTTFDPINNVWVTTIPFDLDDNTFLTGMPWLVPAAGLPADVEPVTLCGTFASDTAGIDIGWRWAVAAYSSFSADSTTLGVKPMNTDHDNSSSNHDNAGTPENFKTFVIPGARGKGRMNYTGSYSGSATIE
jgi:hypothetical protein